jgi:protein required for attachment to host cells
MKTPKTWIVVADGANARVLEGFGQADSFKPVPGYSFKSHAPASRDLISERPGRTFNSTGKVRHAIEPRVDPHEQQEEDFLKSLAGHLDKGLRDHSYGDLIIAAPPRALGVLRKHLSDKVRRHVRGELDNDLVKRPDEKIARLAVEKFLG